jgi:hypothetical protein
MVKSPHQKLALRTLHDAFEHPLNSQTCAIMILGSLFAIEGHWDDLLLSRVMAFLTAPRTVESVAEWTRCLECKHEFPAQLGFFARHLHLKAENEWALVANQYPTFIVHKIMHSIANAIQGARKGPDNRSVVIRRRLERSTTGHKPRPWPQDCRQLLPYGGRDSCRGFCVWLSTDMKDGLQCAWFDLAVEMILECGHEVTPFFATSDCLARTLPEFLTVKYEKWITTPRLPAESRIPNYDDASDQWHDAFEPLCNAARFLQSFRTATDHAELAEFVRRSVGHNLPRAAIVALQWVTAIRKNLQQPPTKMQEIVLSSSWPQFLWLSSYLSDNFDAACTLLAGALASDIAKAVAIFPRLDGWPRGAAFCTLLELCRSKRCAAPACGRTFAAAGTKFQYCAGCGRTPYCSERCQRAAWRHGTLAHRDVCARLAMFDEATNLPRRFSELWIRGEQPVSSTCDAELDHAASAIAAHFRELHAAKFRLLSAYH